MCRLRGAPASCHIADSPEHVLGAQPMTHGVCFWASRSLTAEVQTSEGQTDTKSVKELEWARVLWRIHTGWWEFTWGCWRRGLGKI